MHYNYQYDDGGGNDDDDDDDSDDLQQALYCRPLGGSDVRCPNIFSTSEKWEIVFKVLLNEGKAISK